MTTSHHSPINCIHAQHRRSLRSLGCALLAMTLAPTVGAQTAPMRQWTNLQGRTVQAALVKVEGASAVLQLSNGTTTAVPISALSAADQEFLRSVNAGQTTMPGASRAPTEGAAVEWPKAAITVDPKTITVTPGEQNAAARQYHYRSGNFEFIANAPLAETVMSEVASDFELLKTAFSRLPWGWEPKPGSGSHFQFYLTETEADFIAIGGDERSSGGTKDGKNFIRFSALGLKKVGAKYQYDARQKEPGNSAGMTTRVLAYDYRGRMAPWALNGLESFMRYLVYQSNGTAKFTNLESELKREAKRQIDYGVTPDVPRMVRLMREDWSARRSTATKILLERKLDALLLIYYFGYLEGDGTGAKLHEYFRTTFQETGRRTDLQAMLTKLTSNRDDAAMEGDIKEKFKAINLKLD